MPSVSEWVCLAVGGYLVVHYAWLLDDAFVYFRYGDNLLFLGYGLVFNAGEYVEGFTSPLWMLLLIGLRSAGADYWVLTRGIGLVAFFMFWMLLILVNRRLSPRAGPIVNVPMCYLALNYAVLCYFTSGIETVLVQVAAAAYAAFVLRPGSRGLQVALGLTPVLRPELSVVLAMCVAWSWVRRRRFPWLLVIAGGGFTGAWVLFRIYYYADLLPNTFYLKDTVDFAQGLIYVQDTAGPYWLYWLLGGHLLLMVILLIGGAGRQTATAADKTANDLASKNSPNSDVLVEWGEGAIGLGISERVMMLALAMAVGIYVVKIGGDPRHYRFLAFPFCLCVCSTAGIVEQALARWSFRGVSGVSAVVGLSIAAGSFTFYPVQLSAHPYHGTETHETVNKINDASVHRHNDSLKQDPWAWTSNSSPQDQYAQIRDRDARHPYSAVAVSSWCVNIYHQPGVRFVQSLGLTDPILARMDVHADRPAHKFRLRPLARQMAWIIRQNGLTPTPGMYRRAVEAGIAPGWVAGNLETIEIVERKMFNDHAFMENLRLAFMFPPKIDPGDVNAFSQKELLKKIQEMLKGMDSEQEGPKVQKMLERLKLN